MGADQFKSSQDGCSWSDRDEFMREDIGFTMRRTFNRLIDRIEDALSEHVVTSHQFGVLLSLYHGLARTPGEIARLRFQYGGAITYTLDKLEQRGLVERARSEDDRRVITVTLTDKGEELVSQCLPLVKAATDAFASPLTREERDSLMDMLTRLADSPGA